MTLPIRSPFLLCPLCRAEECPHFIGWTSDGRTIECRDGKGVYEPLRPDDVTINTGVSTRVYRND